MIWNDTKCYDMIDILTCDVRWLLLVIYDMIWCSIYACDVKYYDVSDYSLVIYDHSGYIWLLPSRKWLLTGYNRKDPSCHKVVSRVPEEIQAAVKLFKGFQKWSKLSNAYFVSSRRDPSCYRVILRVLEEIQALYRYYSRSRRVRSWCKSVWRLSEVIETVAKIMLRVIEEIQDAVKEIEEFQ